MNRTILYIGGFQLPERNAAAQRVVGIAKGLRELGCEVLFLNSLKGTNDSVTEVKEREYFGFKCFEYKRESDSDYLLSAKTTLKYLKKIQPCAVIAYNYPAIALNRIRKYCRSNNIKCYADVTEWYEATGKNPIACLVKGIDTTYRMKYVHKKLDGIIAISRYLFDYYKPYTRTVLIPPTVDMSDEKWHIEKENRKDSTSFVYAGVPYASKERLDLIVAAICNVAKKEPVYLNVVGITEEQFKKLYTWQGLVPDCVSFLGRVEHQKALQIVGKSDWSIILRDNTRLVKAGFPTKLVESISCGTPVIANRFSNVYDYLTEENSICVENMDDIVSPILKACEVHSTVHNGVFDFRRFIMELKELVGADLIK